MKHFTTSDGLKLAFHDEGTGLPLLCLPGLTRNSADFQPVVDGFGDRARIIRLDLRGRGDSDHDPNYGNYNVMVEGRDAVELLDHLGLETAAILGTSRGGLIAMTLAAFVKERLLGVMLNDVGPHLEPVGMERIKTYLGVPPEWETLDEAARAYVEGSAAEFPGVDAAKWKWFLGKVWLQTPMGIHMRYDLKLRDAMLEALEAMAASGEPMDFWPFFDMLQGVPLALLRGGNSDLLSPETTAEMQRRRPDMAFTLVADRGHIPFLDEPESVAAIDAFLRKLGA